MNGNKYKILIIEDDEHINNLVATLLEANGYQTLSAYSCEDGMMMYASHRPDLVVLDLGLPDQDGMTFLKRLRKDSLTPVIVLSARSDEKDKVEALDMGANDYVTKPFGSNEFLARIRSTLRMTTHRMQNGMFPGGKFKASGLTIDYDARRVFLHKKEVKLTQTEYNIIAALSEHAGKVMTYSAIIKEIWGYNDEGSIKKLQVNMVNIRKKLGARPGEKNYIVNELGVGYRMCEADEETYSCNLEEIDNTKRGKTFFSFFLFDFLLCLFRPFLQLNWPELCVLTL